MPELAYLYSISQPIMLESDYPYLGEESSTGCGYVKGQGKVNAQGFQSVASENPFQLQFAVLLGPVSTGIDAASLEFQLYQSGIFTDAVACGTDLNHAISVVGFDATGDTPYYIVKNSWGAGWGEDGFVKMAITGGVGMCGI